MAETSETLDIQTDHHQHKRDYQKDSYQRDNDEEHEMNTQLSNPQGESPLRPQTQAKNSRKTKNISLVGSPMQEQQRRDPNMNGIDELTEYAMAREGIELKDLEEVPFEEFLEECNGNVKLAQMRYDFKEAERMGNTYQYFNHIVGLIQDIENRKRQIQMELQQPNFHFAQMTNSPPNIKSSFYQTHQPLSNSRFSRSSQSQAQLPSATVGFPNAVRSLKAFGDPSKKDVDNKIFGNMLKNQIEQELKLKSIKERQDQFLHKEQEMQEKRQREIQRKQEYMHEKQLMKEEKLRRQEIAMKKIQEETLMKMKIKSEISEQRQMKRKLDVKVKLQDKEIKHEIKRKYAQEMFVHQIHQLEGKQVEVKKKEIQFVVKQNNKKKRLEEYVQFKKMKKEQVLRTVQEQKEIDDQKRLDKFMTVKMIEMEKEQRLQEEKQRYQNLRKKIGKEKNQKMQFKVEEAYKKMEEWTQELEKREKAAENNLRQQQKIIQEKLAMKREMCKLKQESAQLKQKRKELKEKLKNDEQMQKQANLNDKMEQYKMYKVTQQHQKQQQLFQAEQKRADMKTAFYHMAVWNVQEAGDIISEILDENDHKKAQTAVKPVSVAEKVRQKAALMRKYERLGLPQRMGHDEISHIDGGGQQTVQAEHYEDDIQRSLEKRVPEERNHQRVAFDERVQQD